MADQNKDNLLHISWQDSMWVPHLNANNIMNYFSERSNPFYSRECNNEFIKMQQNTRVDQLTHMQGIEYILLHTQEPILYIVRKQQRYSPTQVTPLANYHIIGGQVFQTPDLGSIINSRLLACVSNLNSAFTEMQMYSHYHPSKGYWWQFRNQQEQQEQQKKEKEKKAGCQGVREEPASVFQHRRVGSLLEDLQAKFPYKTPPQMQPQQQASQQQQQPPSSSSQPQQQQQTQPQQTSQQQQQSQPQQDVPIKQEDIKQEIKQEVKADTKIEIKTEPAEVKVKIEPGTQPAPQRTTKPPPEKRQRTGL